MNIQPYQAMHSGWTPKLKPWIVYVLAPLRRRYVRRVLQVVDIQIRGLEHLQSVLNEDCGVLITPNHSSHTDPPVLLEAAGCLAGAAAVAPAG